MGHEEVLDFAHEHLHFEITHAVVFGQGAALVAERLGEVAFAHVHALGLGNGLEDEQLAGRFFGLRRHFGAESVLAFIAHQGEEGGQVQAVLRGAAGRAGNVHFHHGVDDALGHLAHGRVLGEIGQQPVVLVGFLHLLLHGGVQLGQGGPAAVRLEVFGDEGVGEFGVFHLALNVVDGGHKHGLFVLQHHGVAVLIGGVVVALGEGDHHVHGLAGLVADDLGQEIVDVIGGARGHGGAAAAGASARKLHPVHAAHVVDVHLVAVFHGAVGDFCLFAEGLHQAVLQFLDVLGGGGDLAGGDRNALVFGQGDVIERFHALPEAFVGNAFAVVQRAAARRGLAGRAGGRGRGSAAGRGGAAAGGEAGGQGHSGREGADTDYGLFQNICSS